MKSERRVKFGMGLMIMVLLISAALIAIPVSAATPETEPNDEFGDANLISLDTPATATTNPKYAGATIEHSGSASYEDSNQDWNDDGELDGCDKNGDPYGDKLLSWHTAAGVHIVSGFTVNEGYRLIIEPGATLKFTSGGYIRVNGALVADGTPESKITFTSNQASPAPGDWGSIVFEDSSDDSQCILDNCVIKYGGYYHYAYQGWSMLHFANASPTITNNLISDSSSRGLFLFTGANPLIEGNTISNCGNAIDLKDGSSPSITNNAITDNRVTEGGYHGAAVLMGADCFPIVSGNTVSGNIYNGILVYWYTYEIPSGISGTWYKNSMPYIIKGYTTVSDGATLTIQPGTVVKLEGGSLGVHGTLITDGMPSDKIIFTSINDDSYGGDTNNDGNASSPAPGDWGSIVFEGSSDDSQCILDNCVIKYGGYYHYAYQGWSMLHFANASPTITNNLISDSSSRGLFLFTGANPLIEGNTITKNSYGIYSASSSNPVINNNNIYNNTDYGVYNADTSLTIDAENNWWGDASGPYDPSPIGLYNPDGKGDKVSDYVDYEPWLSLNQPPIANFTYTPANPVVNETITFNASDSFDPDGTIVNYEWNFGDGDTGTGEVITHSYSSSGDYNVNLTVTDDDGATNTTSKVVKVYPKVSFFDTGPGTYPSIMGTHEGTIIPNKTIVVHKMYTYPCVGTGGHTEYVRFYGIGLDVNKMWNGYTGDYHNITFDPPITLQANMPYNYEIRTGSYPQIIHEQSLPTANGTINCTRFIDANGKTYDDWIPAISLE